MNISKNKHKKKPSVKILFLGETYRADAQTWIKGIENVSGLKIETDEIKTVKFRPIRIIQSLIFILKLLYKSITGIQFDIVLAERSTSYGFFSLFINAKVKVVAQQGISDIYPLNNWSIFIKSILQRTVYKRVDLIHAWGEAMVPAMLKSGANPNKIIIRPKGIDLDKFKFREKLTSENFTLKAIVTRSIEKDYQHWNILRAVEILKKKGVYLQVTIIGGGSLLGEMKMMAGKLDLENNIHFTGRIENTELPKLLNECPIYISVPVTEGVSSSLFEAMACGCFPIVTNLPGTRAFINQNQNGMLVNVDAPEDLAEAILTFLENPSIYQQAIIENRKWIEINCDLRTNMEIFYKIYCNKLFPDSVSKTTTNKS